MTVRTAKVFVQVSLLPEPIVAEDTLERPFARVGAQVDREVGLPAQLALAHRAQEFFAPALVGRGMALLNEILVGPGRGGGGGAGGGGGVGGGGEGGSGGRADARCHVSAVISVAGDGRRRRVLCVKIGVGQGRRRGWRIRRGAGRGRA